MNPLKRLAVIGGETHLGEVTALVGSAFELVAASVREEQMSWAAQTFQCPLWNSCQEMLAECKPDVAAVANENDLRAACIACALEAGCDLIVDKPLALTLPEHERVEALLAQFPRRRLLMLLTLRGHPWWRALQAAVAAGRIGRPVFTHVRMAVQMRPHMRPPWFLDARRSGGLFLDLLIHGLDLVEWITGRRVVALTATTGNLGNPAHENRRDHAAAFCELDDGSSAVVEGQRLLPETQSMDYRATVAGTQGHLDLVMQADRLTLTNPDGAERGILEPAEKISIVQDWLAGGALVSQAASLRANRLALLANASACRHERVEVA